MPRHSEKRILPYTPEQLFDLVADVGSYQHFLPWVAATRIRSESETEMVADLIVGFGALKETFTSKVRKRRPDEIEISTTAGSSGRRGRARPRWISASISPSATACSRRSPGRCSIGRCGA